MKKNFRVVPKKNYLFLLLMFIGVILFTILFFKVLNSIEDKNVNSGYLTNFINKVKLDEVDNLLIEPDSDLFIYIYITGNDDIYKLEKELKKVISSNNLRDNFVSIDATDLDISLLEKYNVSNNNIPAIIYFKDGEFVKSICSDDILIKSTDLVQFLEEYEIIND